VPLTTALETPSFIRRSQNFGGKLLPSYALVQGSSWPCSNSLLCNEKNCDKDMEIEFLVGIDSCIRIPWRMVGGSLRSLKRGLIFLTLTLSPVAGGQASANIQIVDKPIYFSRERIELTRDYMRRHYGIEQSDITIKPEAIIIHYTASSSFPQTWEYFNRVQIEPQRKELLRESQLNVSAQFMVDRDGTIYRLMPETWMARHCIGLNHVAIGIENIGDDKNFKLTEKQVVADSALVRYLVAKYPISYLLGHNEYRRMEKTTLFRENVNGYRVNKSDPGEEFMDRIRAKVADLRLKAPPNR